MPVVRKLVRAKRITSKWIAADIRKELEAGGKEVSSVLRSERELAREYSVARATVRRALQRLVAEGFLMSQAREGYSRAVDSDINFNSVLTAYLYDNVKPPWEWTDLHLHFWNEFQKVAAASGHHLLAIGARERGKEEMVEHLGKLGVRGVVLDSDDLSFAQALRKAGLPLVTVDAAHPAFSAVTQNNFGGAFAITQYLISKGHKRIAWLGYDFPSRGSRIHFTERLGGYLAAMREAGLDAPKELQVVGDIKLPEEGARKLAELIEKQKVIDAVVVLWPEFLNEVGKVLNNTVKPPELGVWWGCLPDARARWHDAFPALAVPAGVEWNCAELARMALARLDEQMRSGSPIADRSMVSVRFISEDEPKENAC
jgi:DNA-binding LacI/PurR family transcriptional regulator